MLEPFVILALGPADEINSVQSGTVDLKQWNYELSETSSRLVTITDGVVTEITEISF